MNLKQIEFALALAEERNFTRAAARCHVVQSALSHQIARLEEELGAVLFERQPRDVRLTEAGEAFLFNARQAMEAVRRIGDDVAAVTGEVRGRLSVGMISSLTVIDMVEVMADFHRRYPHVEISLRLLPSESLLEAVAARTMDVGFVGLWHRQTIDGLPHLFLAEEDLVAIVPPSHALAGRKRLKLAELAEEPLVDFQSGSGARRQTDEAFLAMGLPHRVQFEVSNMGYIERFVQSGLGIALVPSSTAQSFSGVAVIPVQGAPRRRVYAIWQNVASPAAQAFLREVDARLR